MNATNHGEPSPRNEDRVVDPHDHESVLALFRSIAATAGAMLVANRDWSDSGLRDGQYSVDVTIDEMCLTRLHDAGLAVLSEESAITGADGTRLAHAPDVVVVTDPLDGSTNAALGLPWCATSLCLVIDGTPTVALVQNLPTTNRFEAVRGRGATLDGRKISVAAPVELRDAVVAINSRPPDAFRPRQFRAMGATALDITNVAAGGFDAYIDFDDDMIGVWDYLAAVLIVEEAGGAVCDALGRDLTVIGHTARRRPVAASSQALLTELLA